MTKIVLIFKSVPNTDKHQNEQVFIEAHDEQGRSINVGEWAADGEYESLTIDLDDLKQKLEGPLTPHLDAMKRK